MMVYTKMGRAKRVAQQGYAKMVVPNCISMSLYGNALLLFENFHSALAKGIYRI